ncbi:MAG: xanthine dehydrogenase family protein, partial [Anaerolineales bacterium]|nr:xanthine dehydrogenase family protein [Anaerolineales bacterium]
MSEFKYVGHSRPLTDGGAKVTGEQKFLGDLQMEGLLHARLVTSPYAHANIVSIDKALAEQVEGVVAVFTADDLPRVSPSARNKLMLARGRVIFAGQPVAMVVASNAAAAEDGVDLVFVEYDPQPLFTSMRDALKADAPLVWANGSPGETDEAAAHGADVGGSSDAAEPSNKGGENHFEHGDMAAGFAEADLIIEREFTTSIVHQSYLEPQSVVVRPDSFTGGATVWTSTQAPFYVRQEVANILGCEETEVRVIPTLPGGAFGAKFLLYELLVAVVAQKLNRPVRFVLTRSEDMLATNPAPASEMRVKLGVKNDGTFTALEADILFDTGCYPASHGISAVLMGSTYRWPNLNLHYTDVMSFKLSSAAYRAPGTPQGYFALESVIDEAARALAMDPIALRLQNASRPGDPSLFGGPWPNMGLVQVLEKAAAHPIWQNRAALQAQGKGVGVAVGGWPGGIEPTAASAQLHRDGTLHVHIGSVDLTGTPTTF